MGSVSTSLADPPLPPSSNANLRKILAINGENTLKPEPAFNSAHIHYLVNIQYFTTSVVIIPVVEDDMAKVSVEVDGGSNGNVNISKYMDDSIKQMEKDDLKNLGKTSVRYQRDPEYTRPKLFVASKVSNLSVGKLSVRLKVQAEDKSTIKCYELVVERLQWTPDGWKPGSQTDKYNWYRRGAEDGIAEAQFCLSKLYAGEDGGVPNDINLDSDSSLLRDRYLLSSAQQGCLEAQKTLAKNYFEQRVVETILRDELKAELKQQLELERKEASNDNNTTTKDDEQQEEEAVPSLLATLNMEDPSKKGSNTNDNNVGTEQRLAAIDSRALELLDFQKRAAYWYRKASEQGDKQSATTLATMFINGNGVEMDYVEALKWLNVAGQKKPEQQLAQVFAKKSEDDTDKDSLKQYAFMNIDGVGVKRSYEEGIKLLIKSGMSEEEAIELTLKRLQNACKRNANDSEAQYQLALMYRRGVGVECDYKNAMDCLMKSGMKEEEASSTVFEWFMEDSSLSPSSTNYKDSISQLAYLYLDGVGTLPDYKKALDLLVNQANWNEEEAIKFIFDRLKTQADNGDKHAAYQVALMYVDGVGVECDFDQAVKYLELSGSAHERAQRKAAELFEQHANDGDVKAAYQMALMYLDGIGVECDFRKALELLILADQQPLFAQRLVNDRLKSNASNGNIRAAYQLAEMFMDWEESLKYLQEDGFEKDYFEQEAAAWYERAAEQGDVDACMALGGMYIDGIGVPIDFKAAELWFQKAGKPPEYVKMRIKRKLASLKPYYEQLFHAYDGNEDGEIVLSEFEGFYRACKQASGVSAKKAYALTTSRYQGKTKYEILFSAMDEDNSRRIDFEEIWAHVHTHTSLFPKSGKHVMYALQFFGSWDGLPLPLPTEEELAEIEAAGGKRGGSKTPRQNTRGRSMSKGTSFRSKSMNKSKTSTTVNDNEIEDAVAVLQKQLE